MSENKISEITRLIQNPDNFREDINEAMNIISKHFRTKYISPIEQEIKICSDECRKAPTKEQALLEACRPFVKNSEVLDNMLNIVNSINVMKKLMPKEITALSLNDSSIHNDGIYDIDKNCKLNEVETEKAESFVGINPLILVIIILLWT
ncbi:MAG: hypothetical protein ACI4VF_08985 [Lachnospirales bacterium]